jgi:uncharacterized protein (TIGR00299 family) protein
MRALIFDPFAGISGDMTLAALVDLGLPEAWLRDFVGGLGIPGIELRIERVERRHIACARLDLGLPHEHAHRHLADVVAIIEGARLAPIVRDRAVSAFTRLAEAEAAVHGTTPERVHFHEVGALDAIVDIVGAMAACEEMGFEAFYTRPVTLGRGWADMAHGRFPVPPPAVLRILEGVAVHDPAFEGECTTPTGAAILQTLTGGAAPPATFVPTATGFGAGTRDPDDRPNCLRLIAAEIGGSADALWLVQADIDDMPPEYVPGVIDAALAAGAVDCTVTAIVMKKGRPAHRLEALVATGSWEGVRDAIFRGSSSIGMRRWRVEREALARSERRLEWRGQAIRIKSSVLPEGGVHVKPEYEDVARAAAALGLTPYQAYRALLADGVVAEENASSRH